MTRCRYNLHKWRLIDDDLCECGKVQNDEHLFECELSGAFNRDRLDGTIDEEAIEFLDFWHRRGIMNIVDRIREKKNTRTMLTIIFKQVDHNQENDLTIIHVLSFNLQP